MIIGMIFEVRTDFPNHGSSAPNSKLVRTCYMIHARKSSNGSQEVKTSLAYLRFWVIPMAHNALLHRAHDRDHLRAVARTATGKARSSIVPIHNTNFVRSCARAQRDAAAGHQLLDLLAVLFIDGLAWLIPMQDVSIVNARLIQARKWLVRNADGNTCGHV